MKIKLCHAFAAFAVLMLMVPVSGEAAGTAIRGKFSFDGVANCESPPIQNFPVHTEGTAELSTDRRATVDMNSTSEGRVQLNARLGDKPTEAPGGSASLHVAGRHTLRAVRDFPNNYVVVNLTVIGKSCSMTIENKLKPGKRQYTFHTAIGMAYCSKPRIIRAECSPY
jgi:hypothetical protein